MTNRPLSMRKLIDLKAKAALLDVLGDQLFQLIQEVESNKFLGAEEPFLANDLYQGYRDIRVCSIRLGKLIFKHEVNRGSESGT